MLEQLALYDEVPPSPFGLAKHLSMTISELKVHALRDDDIGECVRFMLNDMLAYWVPRTNKDKLAIINYILRLMREEPFA